MILNNSIIPNGFSQIQSNDISKTRAISNMRMSNTDRYSACSRFRVNDRMHMLKIKILCSPPIDICATIDTGCYVNLMPISMYNDIKHRIPSFRKTDMSIDCSIKGTNRKEMCIYAIVCTNVFMSSTVYPLSYEPRRYESLEVVNIFLGTGTILYKSTILNSKM